MRKNLLTVILVCSLGFTQAIAANTESEKGSRNSAAALRIFSDMGFINEEGEYSGLQIILIPYNPYYKDFKEKVVWQAGKGFLEAPLLLDGIREGKTTKITIPKEYDEYGEWMLTLDGNTMFARGPRGLHRELREIQFK